MANFLSALPGRKFAICCMEFVVKGQQQMIDERETLYVLKVAEELSFSQAAKQLYVTQPSLSQCIKKIESELGVTLFDRQSSPLKITCAGAIYIEKAKKIQHVKKELLRELEDLSELKYGHLKIGTSHSRTAYLLTLVLPQFRALYPGIDISLIEGNTEELQAYAINEKTDIALAYLPLHHEYLDYTELVEEEILAALPADHPFSIRAGEASQRYPFPEIDFAELAQEEFIIMKSRRKMRQVFFHLCESCNVSPQVILESQSLVSAQALVGAGIGATLVTDTLALHHRLVENPYYFSLRNKTDKRVLIAAYRRDTKLSKAAQAFIGLVKKVLSEKRIT